MQSKPDKSLSLIIELMMFVGLHRGKCMDVFYFTCGVILEWFVISVFHCFTDWLQKG